MIIRPVRVEDAAAVARVHIDSWHVAYRGLVPDETLQRMTYEWSEERLRKSFAAGGEETYLAAEGQTVMGLLTLGACRDADREGTSTGEIWGIYVAPAHWRRGIGQRFVLIAERLLAARGFEEATLWVLHGNEAARRFYEAMGFCPDGGAKIVQLGEPLEAVRYRKRLPRDREAPPRGEKVLPPIRHRTYIHAPPGAVYETLTTASGWDAWFTQGAEVDARPGGWIHFRWVDYGADRVSTEDGGPVLETIPGERLVFQWSPGETVTTVAFELEARGPGTLVTLTEQGHLASERNLAALLGCAVGWGEALTLLKMYLEHGIRYGPVPEGHDG
jgi:uncharacterized protein YndB with AHSA1/START domain/ribosomal protein S18 acetylase RimI-like enzyme